MIHANMVWKEERKPKAPEPEEEYQKTRRKGGMKSIEGRRGLSRRKNGTTT
jgi:hypothetical protein